MSAHDPASPEGLATTCLRALPLRAGHLPLADVIDLYMAHYAGRDPTRIQRLTWWRGKIGHLRIEEVSDDHLHAALEDLKRHPTRYYAGRDADGQPIFKAKKRSIAPATVNRYAASIAAVFTWAVRRRVTPKGWVHPCRALEREPENNGRTRFLSTAELKRLLAQCSLAAWPKMYLLVLLALTTGARKGELLGLRWSDVDLERAVVHVGVSKNGDPRTLPLTPPVVEEIKRLPAGAAASLVFGARRRPDKPHAFEPMWHDVMAAAGIKKFKFHDLRHTCASLLAQNGATLLEIADVLGHRQLAMTKRYSHLTSQHKAALVGRVLGSIA